MRNKKDVKLYLIIGIIALSVIGLIIGIIIYFNSSKKSYTFIEKKWINDNINNVIDISVPANLPVFASSGTGVFYDFLKDFSKDTNLTFNKVSNKETSYSFNVKKDPNKKDVVLYKDHYVVVSKTNIKVSSLNDLQNHKIAVLENDLTSISEYLNTTNGISITSYRTLTEIKEQLEDSASFAIIPLNSSLQEIVEQNYNIVYHLDGLNVYYTLSTPGTNDKFNSILNKFYTKWKDKEEKLRNKYILDIYYKSKGLTELKKEEIMKDDYIVGYIKSLPYEGNVHNKFSGITAGYLEGFSEFSGSTYKYKEYKSVEKLASSLNSKKIDINLNYYGLSSSSYDVSPTLGSIDYYVLLNNKNNLIIDSLSSLKNEKVLMLSNTILTRELNNTGLLNIKESGFSKQLLKSLNNSSILIVDKEFYDLYKTTELKEFKIGYKGNVDAYNEFLLNNSNTEFNKLFNFYLSITSPNMIKATAVYNTASNLNSNLFTRFIIKNISYIVICVLALAFFFYKFNQKIQISKKIKKEDKLLYLDVMTNLKNRNYLNENIEYWEENKVYPQAIITVDLNNIKSLNDLHGHEEGDKQIKAASNILIKTQRENSEIVRTDGNEFLIYIIGYNENMVTTYIHKLTKEFRSLPYSNGASIGYSMIEDEIKTIDDAINESLIMMRKNKEVQSENKA
ncbi:MAG: GGDEF domain-containing protein [Bacilli bacterium]